MTRGNEPKIFSRSAEVWHSEIDSQDSMARKLLIYLAN